MSVRRLFYEMLEFYITPLLVKQGFAGKKGIYRIGNRNTIGMIGFQRSVESTVDKIKFTANIGIASKTILAFKKDNYDIKKMEVEMGHWVKRIGDFLSDPHDKWWYIDETTDIGSLCIELQSLIDQFVLPEMASFMDEKYLMEFWCNGMCMGITEFQRLEYLCILAKHYDKKDLLIKTKDEILKFSANKPIASSVSVFLRQLDSFGAE